MEVWLEYAVGVRLKHAVGRNRNTVSLCDNRVTRHLATLLEQYFRAWRDRGAKTSLPQAQKGNQLTAQAFHMTLANLVRLFPLEPRRNQVDNHETQIKNWWDLILRPIIRDITHRRLTPWDHFHAVEYYIQLRHPTPEEIGTLTANRTSILCAYERTHTPI